MKKVIIAAIMLLSWNAGIQAQSVQKQGNNFTQVSNKKSGKATKTQYTYTDSKGETSCVLTFKSSGFTLWV